jgi:hypothetical protein
VIEQAPAKLHVDAARGVAERIGAQILKRDVEQADERKADGNHDERGHAFVHQHLVDHDLEEEWGDQREQLDEQRGGQHMRQRPAVAPDRGEEPAEAEGPGVGARPAHAPRNQDELAGRKLDRFGRRHVAEGFAPGKAEAQPPVRVAQHEHGELAVLHGQDGGQRDAAEPLGRRVFQDPGLEAQPLRGAHQVAAVGSALGEAEVVGKLHRLGRDVVVARDQGERLQPGINALRRSPLRARGGI